MTLDYFKRRAQDNASDYREHRGIVIVALGDSVTMGATKANTFDFRNVYHAQLKTLLEDEYFQTVFSVINSGIGGETAAHGLERIDRDVISFHPDLVIVGFALNDSSAGMNGLCRYKQNMESIIQEIRDHTKADIILLTPNFMNTAANPNISREHLETDMPETFAKRQNNGTLKSYAETVKDIGKQYSTPVADVYSAWEQLAKQGVDANALLANGLNHPIGKAHAIPAQLIFQQIKPEHRPTFVELFS